MIRLFSLFAAALTLSACAGNPMVAVMQNPKTGEITQCKVDNAVEEDTVRDEVEACARAYEKGGWKRLSE